MSFIPKRTVLVPIDFSKSSVPSIHTALEFAAKPEDIHVIHVIPGINPVSPLGIYGDVHAQKKIADKAMSYLKTFLADHEIKGVTIAIEIGSDGSEIIEYAERHKADLIVIPSHGHSGIKRALLGSVAERVIRHAHCPTLILRREDSDTVANA